MDVVDFLQARLDEDEAVARAAIDPDRPGTHWHWWRADEADRPALPDEETGGEYLEDGGLWLCTVEEFPSKSGVRSLPAVVISTAEEVKTGGAFHIARHDPARVLREVEAKRRIIEAAGDWPMHDEYAYAIEQLAAVYADHPDYDPREAGGTLPVPDVKP